MVFKDVSIKKRNELLSDLSSGMICFYPEKGVTIEGFKKILSISDSEIRISYHCGIIKINGSGLKIIYLNNGESDVIGRISGIEYEKD